MRQFVSPVMIVVLGVVTFVAHGQPVSAATLQPAPAPEPCKGLRFLEEYCRHPQRPPIVLDGETLFRGLFFARGPVAALFPEIVYRFPSMSAEAKGVVDQWIVRISNRLRQRDARFFDRLATGLQSGDHVAIANTMDYTARMLQAALGEEIGAARPVLMAQSEGPGQELNIDGATASATVSASADGAATATNEGDAVFIAAAAVVAAAVAAVVVVAGALAAVVNTAAVFNQVALWHGPGGASTDLQREYWVNLIAERLPHHPAVDTSLLKLPGLEAKPVPPLIGQVEGGLEIAANAPSDGTATNANSNGPGDVIAINLDQVTDTNLDSVQVQITDLLSELLFVIVLGGG